MPDFGGFIELLIIAFAALLLLGPKELPVVLKSLGKIVYKCRQMTAGFRHYMDHHIHQGEIDAFEERAREQAKRHDDDPKT